MTNEKIYIFTTILGMIFVILLFIIFKLCKSNKELNILLDLKNKEFDNAKKELNELHDEIDRNVEQIKVYEKEIQEMQYFQIHNNTLKKENIYIGKKALVGDYNENTSYDMIKFLQSLGFNVDIVRTGNDIVQKIKNGYHYDIIFTNNIHKDGFNGENVLEELHKIVGFNTPVVIHTISQNKRSYFINECGFDEYLAKPVTLQKLKPVLNRIFKKKVI